MRLERATSRPQEGQDWLGEADKESGEEQWKDVGSRLIYAQPRIPPPREGQPVMHYSRFHPQPHLEGSSAPMGSQGQPCWGWSHGVRAGPAHLQHLSGPKLALGTQLLSSLPFVLKSELG